MKLYTFKYSVTLEGEFTTSVEPGERFGGWTDSDIARQKFDEFIADEAIDLVEIEDYSESDDEPITKLIYTGTQAEVQRGDEVSIRGRVYYVNDITPPHKPSSTGRVNLVDKDGDPAGQYYPSVIGAEWVNRTDQ